MSPPSISTPTSMSVYETPSKPLKSGTRKVTRSSGHQPITVDVGDNFGHVSPLHHDDAAALVERLGAAGLQVALPPIAAKLRQRNKESDSAVVFDADVGPVESQFVSSERECRKLNKGSA